MGTVRDPRDWNQQRRELGEIQQRGNNLLNDLKNRDDRIRRAYQSPSTLSQTAPSPGLPPPLPPQPKRDRYLSCLLHDLRHRGFSHSVRMPRNDIYISQADQRYIVKPRHHNVVSGFAPQVKCDLSYGASGAALTSSNGTTFVTLNTSLPRCSELKTQLKTVTSSIGESSKLHSVQGIHIR